ncbi:hypothetical protein BDV32DRAFT_154313 [Aspergillus pseudonomiae]|uniref:Uncharacterized protein n=1 Tax=Aspergillus pseudonomiae TaxID=1506151 RepID=A0A5N6HND2_9EURO|nr:uncharacterized protein BDV37DRAFT_288136 [Aspergillus pseudonomiae]KAB8255364.1 hypothetical protein BDV32DRAFT_154313 [Aspergillus pseudonomiae]KAE8398817.1 hypothetical protein BDV37DRAFT_288136 [Aspergillus pseudonomiae]
MTTILLLIYLFTITTFLHPGWAQTNQYAPSSHSPLQRNPPNHILTAYTRRTPNNLCSTPGTHYCTHSSLHSPEILSCVTRTRAELRSCNIELARIIPKGYEEWALCYESSPAAGDAVCAFNGTGYTRKGATVAVPETGICEDEIDESGSIDAVDFVSLGEEVSSSLRYGLGSGSIHAMVSSADAGWSSFRPVTTPGIAGVGESRAVDPGDWNRVVTVLGSGSGWRSLGDGVGGSQETTRVGGGVATSGLGLDSTSALASAYVSTSTGSLPLWNGTSAIGLPVVTGSVSGFGALWLNGVWYVYVVVVLWALGWAW